MIKPHKDDTLIVSHARRELEMADLFTAVPENEYDGSLARATLALIKLFDRWTRDNTAMMQTTHQLFNSLIAGELLSAPTTEPDEWEKIERDDKVIYRNKRSPFYVTNDIKFRTWTNIATHEKGYCKNHITGEVPKDAAEKTSAEGTTGKSEGSDSQSSDDQGRGRDAGVAEEGVENTPKPEATAPKPKAGKAKK